MNISSKHKEMEDRSPLNAKKHGFWKKLPQFKAIFATFSFPASVALLTLVQFGERMQALCVPSVAT